MEYPELANATAGIATYGAQLGLLEISITHSAVRNLKTAYEDPAIIESQISNDL